MKRVVYYLNQFFGQIGGEDMADYPLEVREGTFGVSEAFQRAFSQEELVVTHTIICGDNYFAENTDAVLDKLEVIMKNANPDIVVAGPAFNAGRYGMACGNVVKLAQQRLGLPAVSCMYQENPGVEMFKLYGYIIPSAPNAAGMRKDLKKVVALVKKLVNDEEIGTPEEEGYYKRGIRKMVKKDEIGAVRAVNMLLDKLNERPFVTELPMPKFSKVVPSAPIADLSKATIAVMTSGGIVPLGNPDRLEALSCTKYAAYTKEDFNGNNEVVDVAHGGYDPTFAQENGNRVLPVDVLEDLEKENVIGKFYPYYYVTVGNGMAVDKATSFGEQIAKEVKGKVDGVILTST